MAYSLGNRALPQPLSINGGRTRKGWQTSHLGTGTHKASLPRPTATKGGRTSSPPKNYFFDVLDDNGLSKPTDNVGQQAKDNLHGGERQVS